MPKRKRSKERAAPAPADRSPDVSPLSLSPTAERPYAGEIQTIDDERLARNLAHYLIDEDRPVPIVVLTTKPGETTPAIPPGPLVAAAAGKADVVVMVTGDVSRAFEADMPAGTHVFGGAGRVYPTGSKWTSAPHTSRLRLITGARTPEIASRDLVRDLTHHIRAVAARRKRLEREERARILNSRPAAAAGSVEPANATYTVVGERAAERLATRLMHPERDFPLLVISIPTGQLAPSIDVAQLEDHLKGLVEIALLPTDRTSWRLADMLPPGTNVYGGAARVYPPGTQWMQRIDLAPLRFSYGPDDEAAATEVLLADAMRVARLRTHGAATRPASGIVRGLVDETRALVELSDGVYCTIWSDLTLAQAPLSSLLAVDQRVSGILDESSRRLDITDMLTKPTLDYSPGDVVLARVRDVRPARVSLALLPGVEVLVPRELVTSNPRDALTSLFSLDEVVAARVGRDEDGELMLRLDDVDDDEVAVRPPALTRGGPPWLSLAGPEPEEDEEESVDWDTLVSWRDDEGQRKASAASPAPSPTPGPTPAPAPIPTPSAIASPSAPAAPTAPLPAAMPPGAAARIADLTQRLRDADRQNVAVRERAGKLRLRIDALEKDVRALRTDLRQTKRQLAAKRLAGWGGEEVSVDEMVRFAVFRAWRTRLSTGERRGETLPDYTLGPDFLPTVKQLHGLDQAKLVDVMVDVLTGRAAELDSRALHRLRTGPGGDDPYRERADGAKAYRVALERNSPSARRLHYWKLGEVYEFARVVTHDDMRI